MKNEKLDILVQKYVEAETSQEEERALRAALTEEKIPDKYADLQALFGYFELQKTVAVPDFTNPTLSGESPRNRIISMRWIAAAASVVILIVAFFWISQNNGVSSADTFTDPNIAAENAVKALELLSTEINKGQNMAVDQIKELENLNKYLNIF